MNFVRRIGIKKFLMTLAFLFSVMSILSGLFIAITYTQNVKSITSSYVKSSKDSGELIASSIEFSMINSKVASLLTQRDLDQLEIDLKTINDEKSKLLKKLEDCGGQCHELQSEGKLFFQEVDTMINSNLLLGKYAEAIDYYINNVVKKYNQSLTIIKTMENVNSINQTQEIKKSESRYKTALIIIVLLSGILVILSVFMGYIFKKSIITLLIDMEDKLKTSTHSLKKSAEKISETAIGLSQASTQQSSSIQSSTAAISQISEMTQKNNDYAKTVAEKANSSQKSIIDGQSALSSLIKSMEKLNESNRYIESEAQKNEKEFEEIMMLISDIGEKTRIINDIVFQTKLLSFNASVEAARAGEHGKGFAVVAEEVGNLASMSGNAAMEINTMLETSIKRVKEIAESSKINLQRLVSTGKNSLNEGNTIANSCHQILEHIGSESKIINDMLFEMDRGSMEQADGIQHVNKSMNELNLVANQNSKIAHETSDLSGQIKNDSDMLEDVVVELNQTLHGVL